METKVTSVSKSTISFAETNQFKNTFLDYISGTIAEKGLGPTLPRLADLEVQMATKASFPAASRSTLVQHLKEQYKTWGLATDGLGIEQLADSNTFTITTGHQLSIFLGPLYVIYKAISTIRIAEEAKLLYPDSNFIPVFWLSGEDHDIDEIGTIKAFGRDLLWETTQEGPAGFLNTEGLAVLLQGINGIDTELWDIYLAQPNLMAAQAHLLHHLLGSHGLVLLDASAHILKKEFIPTLERELLEGFSYHAVKAKTAKLEAAGYKAQIVPRELNLFWMEKGLRKRIVAVGDGYQVLDSNSYTQAEMLELVRTQPENFSPNVVLRPLYQETILPNLAYVGGPAELAYWLQLTDVFTAASVPLPLLWPRNSALVLQDSSWRKWEKLGLNMRDAFLTPAERKHKILANQAEERPIFAEEQKLIASAFEILTRKARAIDATLVESIAADQSRLEKQVEASTKKIEKAFERKYEQVLQQVERIVDKINPGGALQERSESFLSMTTTYPNFIDILLQNFHPEQAELVIFTLL